MQRWTPVAAALLMTGCALVFPRRAEVPPGPRDLQAASPQERAGYVRAAQLWRATPIDSLDLLAGPPGDDALDFQEAVTCEYEPDEKLGGKTPKFNCALAPGDVARVKYGADNGEVYAEVAGTRLFWALGFGADRQYPVIVTCRGCSADPWERRAPVPGAVATFDPAIVERPAEGSPIEVRRLQKGWDWWELQTVDERAGGAPLAHVDALRLLAAFVQHGDNKEVQQRLVCLPGGVARDAAGHETCTRPFLVTADLGATFARSGIRNRNKFELHHWKEVPVWKDRDKCIAKLKRSFSGSFSDPRISEAGRAFLAGQLMRLSERQIRDLFVAARADRVGERIAGEDGRLRAVTVDDWVQVFLERRAAITDHRCPG